MYNHKEIEEKWVSFWEKEQIYKTEDKSNKEKFYVLDMFPYPSGDGLHAGHTKGYTASDVVSRFKRMRGYNVLHPMGWDSFGLPAERYAIANKTHPSVAISKATKYFKEQQMKLGFSYDWDREITTSDPKYYKWTQWAFTKMFDKGLVYRAKEPVIWCPECRTVLAQEDLEGDAHEICGKVIEEKILDQWVIAMTKYADRLLEGLEDVDWPEYIKEIQRNWIGKSIGYNFIFDVADSKEKLEIFTTRADTFFGVTFIAINPNSPIIQSLKDKIENFSEIVEYRKKMVSIKSKEDSEVDKGVEIIGISAIHPATKSSIPIYVTDYVLEKYGTGAVMGVPAHDQRDYQFAQKNNLEIKKVVDLEGEEIPNIKHGVLVNSLKFDGLSSTEAILKIGKKYGNGKKTMYKLKDWTFARQRYWGEPTPLIFCGDKVFSVKEKSLPVELPPVENYEPTDDARSPLSKIDSFKNVECSDGSKGERETDTMPQWAGSSWYFLRYIDPHNDEELISKKKEKHFMPVDLYIGGVEHAARHMIYARFWNMFLNDIGVVGNSEPFKKFVGIGLLLAEDGLKMSKRRKDGVVDPIEVVDTVGADAYRLFILFLGPISKSCKWNSKSISGARRFIERVVSLQEKVSDSVPDKETDSIYNETAKKVTNDIEELKFNTAISQLMIFSNHLMKLDNIPKDIYINFIKLLSPFSPFITEEIWSKLGNSDSIHLQSWPDFDESKILKDTVNIAIQVNGKLKGVLSFNSNVKEAEVVSMAKEQIKGIDEAVENSKKIIYIPYKILNIVK